MKPKYLIDSVIIIDHLNGISKATDWLSKNKNSVISVITRAEILSGTGESELYTIKSFLDSFTCLPVDSQTADKAAQLRKKHKLKLPDAIQAALSIINNVSLATRDRKDFGKKFNFVKIPYNL